MTRGEYHHHRSARRIIDAANAAVPTLDLADMLAGAGGLRRVGKAWVGRCVLPDHEDRTPSFSVDPAKNLWNCFGCNRGGDAVRLACLTWGYQPGGKEEQMAAADLLHTFGHEIPGRPPTWYAKEQRQKEARAAFERVRVGACQRRVYELLRREQDAIGNTEPTEAELEYMWEGARHIAALLVADRLSRPPSGAERRGAA